TGILDLTVGIKGTSGDSFSGTGERGDVRINHWYELSHLFDPALPPSGENPLTGEFMVSVAGMYPSGSDHEGKSIEIEYIMAINLTSIFGRGQEPDKETMDYIISKIPLSYFDGK